jgi:hypothetical protein
MKPYHGHTSRFCVTSKGSGNKSSVETKATDADAEVRSTQMNCLKESSIAPFARLVALECLLHVPCLLTLRAHPFSVKPGAV